MPQFEDDNEMKGYPWPASALTVHEMAILVDLRERTGTPICRLLKQSVNFMCKIIGGKKQKIEDQEIQILKTALLNIANSDENDLGVYAKECEQTACLALKEIGGY